MDDSLFVRRAEHRYPICPDCSANLFIGQNGASIADCPDCGLEMRLAASALEEHPSAYYVGTLARRKRRKLPPQVERPEQVYALMRPLLAKADRELFYTLLLSTKNHVLEIALIAVGSLSASLVHPREVLKPAIRRSAAAFIVVHNHPSGIPDPSAEDITFTQRLQRGGELLGIRLLDHVIVARDSFVSLKEGGHI